MPCPSCRAENEPAATACSSCGAPLGPPPTSVIVSVDLSPGTALDDRYELLAALGRGGMGSVYKARDRMLDELVAIKVLRPDFAQDPRMAERFRSEIRLARKVRHPNVCAIHDYGEYRGLLYISMELVEGVDLKQVVRQQGALPHERAYAVAIEVAEGLQAVHDVAIVHRDLKTPNIMLDARGHARLMDFGIAKRQGAEGGTLTATGQVVGTPEYMSPEQAQGLKVDSRSDLYALGAVVYEIFSGRVPFRGETPISTILKHLHEPPPLDDPAAAGIPTELRPLLRRALAKDPRHRPASARDFALDLARARDREAAASTATTRVDGRATTAAPQPAGRAEQPGAPARIGLALLAAGLVVGGGSLLLLRQTRGVPPSPQTPAESRADAAMPTPAPPAPPPPSPRPTPLASSPPTTRAAATTVPAPRPRPTADSEPRSAVPAPRPAAEPTATPAEPGLLLVAVRPWGEVSIDGKIAGTTPLDRIPLAAGTHQVRIRHPGYEVWEASVVVRPGQLERLLVDLPTQAHRK